MSVDIVINMIGPVVLIVNIASLFLCFRPKNGTLFTIAVLAAYGAAVHFLFNPFIMYTPLAPYGGVIMLPATLLLFRGQFFQIMFAFFMQSQLTSILVHIADASVGSALGIQNPIAPIIFFLLAMLLLSIYMAMVLRFGRKFCERIFVDGRRSDWVIYSSGAAFSFIVSATLNWQILGALLYIALLLFIVWSFGVLCYAIISIHEKSAQTHQAETLQLQMSAMREQTDAEKKHREDMEILRHEMRHEMGVIMALYRTGKAAEAETVYADWQTALDNAVPALLCAEPMLNAVLARFERKAKKQNTQLYVKSNIPGVLPVDAIKLSVMVSNALENALTAAVKVAEDNKRIIRVKLVKNGAQIGLEVTNPCASPVVFDENGLPVTNEIGHGIGVRSIAAFARDNDYMLNFSNIDGKFTLRLLIGIGNH